MHMSTCIYVGGHTVDDGKALSWSDDLVDVDFDSPFRMNNDSSINGEMSIYSLGIGGSHLLCIREGTEDRGIYIYMYIYILQYIYIYIYIHMYIYIYI
jgi:hypothetical protein